MICLLAQVFSALNHRIKSTSATTRTPDVYNNWGAALASQGKYADAGKARMIENGSESKV